MCRPQVQLLPLSKVNPIIFEIKLFSQLKTDILHLTLHKIYSSSNTPHKQFIFLGSNGARGGRKNHSSGTISKNFEDGSKHTLALPLSSPMQRTLPQPKERPQLSGRRHTQPWREGQIQRDRERNSSVVYFD